MTITVRDSIQPVLSEELQNVLNAFLLKLANAARKTRARIRSQFEHALEEIDEVYQSPGFSPKDSVLAQLQQHAQHHQHPQQHPNTQQQHVSLIPLTPSRAGAVGLPPTAHAQQPQPQPQPPQTQSRRASSVPPAQRAGAAAVLGTPGPLQAADLRLSSARR